MPRADIPSRTWDPSQPPPRLTEPTPAPLVRETPRERRRRRVRTHVLAALLFVALAAQLGRLELGFLAIYCVARAVELIGARGNLWLSTGALWSVGVGMLLIYARGQSWASLAEVSVVLFSMGVARVGRREHPGNMAWLLGLVALAACWPPEGKYSIAAHGLLAVLLFGLASMWMGDIPHEWARTLADQFGGRFDLETSEIRVPKGGASFVAFLHPPRCTGPMPPRVANEGAEATVRICDCAGCRRFDPQGESQTVRVEVDGRTVTIVHRGFESLVRSMDRAELRALLGRLATLPHGKLVLADGQMTVRAGQAPLEGREADPSVAGYRSSCAGEQVIRLTFALYDYLDRSATETYR